MDDAGGGPRRGRRARVALSMTDSPGSPQGPGVDPVTPNVSDFSC